MFHDIASIVTTIRDVLIVLLPVLIGLRLVLAVVRFVMLPAAGKRLWLPARWHRLRWRWLCANLGLSYLDKHRRGLARPGSTAASVGGTIGRLRFPRARITPDGYGFIARVKTVPGVGRAEFEQAAGFIADAWRCVRVQVHQPKSGRVILRGLRTDPLTVPLSMADAPAGVYGSSSAQDQHSRSWTPDIRPLRLYLGRDEWGQDRWLHLPGLTGITVGGLPGYGKTSLINSWLVQLAPLPVEFVFIDGKGGGDYTDWSDRAWLYTGDELPAAAAALQDVHSLMRKRFATVLEQTGHRNAWHAGPSEKFPLIFTVIDECHTFFDLDAVKGQRDPEKQVRACRTLAGQLVKKGRSVLMVTVFITQKQTSDAIPTAIRDNCRFGLSFATKTTDAAVAALGESIRQYPGFDPVTLQEAPAYVGAYTAALPTGHDPFVRVRAPEVSEAAAAARAAETAGKRRDPAAAPVSAPAAESPVPAAPAAA